MTSSVPTASRADRHLQRRDAAHGAAGVEHRERVAEGGADDGQRADELTSSWTPTRSATPRKPRPTPTRRSPRTLLGSIHVASSTVKLGAAAWITPASPESIRVSAKPMSQNGSAERARDEAGHPETADVRDLLRAKPMGSSTEEPDRQPAEGDHGRLGLVDADLDEEERGAPDRGQHEQEAEIAPDTVRRYLARRRGQPRERGGAVRPPARLAS